MAKGGIKLMKLKSVVLKKLNSFKQSRPCNVDDMQRSDDVVLHPVYVGKTRRRYLVSTQVVEHPVFRELVERPRETSEDENEMGSTINVECEVVLFEHLLWMLENADPQPDSLDDLVDFYAC